MSTAWPKELEDVPPGFRFVDRDGRPVFAPLSPLDPPHVVRVKEWLAKAWPEGTPMPKGWPEVTP